MRRLSLLLFLCVALSYSMAQEENDCSVNENDDNRPEPRVVLKDEVIPIEKGRFQKHYGSFPSGNGEKNGNGDSGVVPTYYYVLNSEKKVLYVPNFLNQTIAEELKAFCIDGNRFVQSRIRGYGDDSSVAKHNLRTSESCSMVPAASYLSNPRFHMLLKEEPMSPQVSKIAREVDVSWDIAQKASKILRVDPSTVEALQLVRYLNPDAEYKLHHDHGGYYGKSTEHRPWTMLIFLNDLLDNSGGHTSFPELGLEVIPRGRDALIWSNTNDDGTVDPDMVHMGKPPSKEGLEKYAVNVWFGEESFSQRVSKEGGTWS